MPIPWAPLSMEIARTSPPPSCVPFFMSETTPKTMLVIPRVAAARLRAKVSRVVSSDWFMGMGHHSCGRRELDSRFLGANQSGDALCTSPRGRQRERAQAKGVRDRQPKLTEHPREKTIRRRDKGKEIARRGLVAATTSAAPPAGSKLKEPLFNVVAMSAKEQHGGTVIR